MAALHSCFHVPSPQQTLCATSKYEGAAKPMKTTINNLKYTFSSGAAD